MPQSITDDFILTLVSAIEEESAEALAASSAHALGEHATDALALLGGKLRGWLDSPAPQGVNTDLINKVLDPRLSCTLNPDTFLTAPDDLTPDQRAAFIRAVSSDVTYIWGPPGTGKTITLSAIASDLFASNKRVLLVSHTNRAVDGILHGLCNRILGRARSALPEGSVVRIGAISRSELQSKYGRQIELESLNEAQRRRLRDRIDAISKELDLLRAEGVGMRHQIALMQRREAVRGEVEELQRALSEARRTENGLSTFLRVLRVRYGEQYHDGHPIDQITRSMRVLTAELLALTTELGAAPPIDELDQEVTSNEQRQSELNETLVELEQMLAEPARHNLQRARVVACTATQAVLRSASLGQFDIVIIDEASMLPLPFALFLAGLAQQAVVIGGDFRQLPPISIAQTPNVKKWFARDIFEVAGIVDLVDRQEDHRADHSAESEFLKILTLQFRGHEALSSLVNQRFYGGKLVAKSSNAPVLEQQNAPLWLSKSSIVVIDTSKIRPRGSTHERSKLNLAHALIVREIAALLRSAKLTESPQSLGIISPYRPQVALIEKLLHEIEISNVAVGTAHRFQGAERDTIVLDLTESDPHRIGSFFGASTLRETGARLLNVSLSRANQRLIVVANLEFLRNHLSQDQVLSGILDDLARIGERVDAREILTDAILGEVVSTEIPSALQRFDRDTFLAGFTTDMRSAQASIRVISSQIHIRLAHIFATIARPLINAGVSCEIFTRSFNTADAQSDSIEARRVLEAAGVVIKDCQNFDLEGAIFDDEVVWIANSPILNSLEVSEILAIRTLSASTASFIRGALIQVTQNKSAETLNGSIDTLNGAIASDTVSAREPSLAARG